ncbi:hypothetical protein POPTR_002G063601v4 [Populus trichocarpa]|uniref:Uncharacterized protein n=1 Tax=Populus trichocarpa TaxID=3694 RepID=A0ACC0TCF5_POPTR|nr:hypothetical protein BDE02_02G059400 [Populus trichocarpa]KAI9399220.1 hypothetical protein POPTR_002G063601v4 [Populus trichocarpa]
MCTVPLNTDLQFSKGKFEGIEQYARNKRIQVCNFCMLELHRSSPVMNSLDVVILWISPVFLMRMLFFGSFLIIFKFVSRFRFRN